MKKLISLITLVLVLTSLSSNAFDESVVAHLGDRLNQRVDSEVKSSAGADIYVLTENGNALSPAHKFPTGTRFSFRPSVTFKGAKVYNSDRSLKPIRGRFFGSIIIEEDGLSGDDLNMARDLNSQRIFIYEWSINKDNYIKAVFDVEPHNASLLPNNEPFLWDEFTSKGAWTAFAAEYIYRNRNTFLDANISDVAEFCPNFPNASDEEKASFWIHLVNEIAKKESGFDPLVSNDESKFGDGSLDVVSRGLLQISASSTGGYRADGCRISKSYDLYDPKTAIDCGLSIFKKWLRIDRCISCKSLTNNHRGISRYWSPMREPYEVKCSVCKSGKTTIGHRGAIVQATAAKPACQL